MLYLWQLNMRIKTMTRAETHKAQDRFQSAHNLPHTAKPIVLQVAN